MKRTKKQFTVDRIVPESEGKLHIKVGIHLLLSLCLCLGSLSVLHAEGNEYPSISAMVYLLMIATLVCCVLSQRKREKQWMKVFYYGGPWLLVLILTSVLLTGFNIYQKIVKWGGAGALVPITGFANSVAAPAIEYKAEGHVYGIGCKIFTIAGPVILYGIFTSWILGLIYYMIR